ncbi:MAG: hypothetical protein QM655_02425 [Nocardioidaceae bacterium]
MIECPARNEPGVSGDRVPGEERAGRIEITPASAGEVRDFGALDDPERLDTALGWCLGPLDERRRLVE